MFRIAITWRDNMYRVEYFVEGTQKWDSTSFWNEDYDRVFPYYETQVKLYPNMKWRLVETQRVVLHQSEEV